MARRLIHDSGHRKEFESGMVRDVTEGKVNWALVADGPMLERWAIHLTGGGEKYTDRNWMKATGPEELERFRASAFRHFMQWYYGLADEDHAAATIFNMNGAEYVSARMNPDPPFDIDDNGDLGTSIRRHDSYTASKQQGRSS